MTEKIKINYQARSLVLFRKSSIEIFNHIVSGALLFTLVGFSTMNNVTAATITDNVLFSFGDTTIASAPPNYGATSAQDQLDILVKLDKFDPTLGALTDVTFNLTSALETSPASTPFKLFVTGWATGNGQFHSVADSVFTTRITDPFANILFENSFIDQVEVSNSGGFSTAETEVHDGAINNASFIAPSLAGYQGIDQYDVMLSQIFDVSITPLLAGGKGESSLDGRWSGNLEVVYTYSVVPVPAAVWLFGSGLLGLVGIARRKKT